MKNKKIKCRLFFIYLLVLIFLFILIYLTLLLYYFNTLILAGFNTDCQRIAKIKRLVYYIIIKRLRSFGVFICFL